MANVPAQFQLFAITFLLATPSELHDVWLGKDGQPGQSWETIAAKLSDLGFSDEAIQSAKEHVHDPLSNALQDTFRDMSEGLADGLPDVYDTGTHPTPPQASLIVSALRGIDGTVAHVNSLTVKMGAKR